jgi:FixJ family two-component response regulator
MFPNKERLVYLIDDDDGVRDSTKSLLTSASIEVSAHSTARAFFEVFDPANAGCIILDLHMPDMSGFQALDVLRERVNTVPVILFTGRSDSITDEIMKQSGAVALLSKPVADDTLIELVQHLIWGGPPKRRGANIVTEIFRPAADSRIYSPV